MRRLLAEELAAYRRALLTQPRARAGRIFWLQRLRRRCRNIFGRRVASDRSQRLHREKTTSEAAGCGRQGYTVSRPGDLKTSAQVRINTVGYRYYC